MGFHCYPARLWSSKIEENHQELPVEKSCQKMLWGWLDSSSENSNRAKDLIQAINDVELVCYAEELKTGFKFIIICMCNSSYFIWIDPKTVAFSVLTPHNTPYNKFYQRKACTIIKVNETFIQRV